MLSIKLWLCAPIFLSSVVVALKSNRALEGYPGGFLGDCPGTEKPAIITRKSLKYLTITVSGIKATPLTKRKKYNYFETRELARDPTMDFSKKTFMFVGGYFDSADYPLVTMLENYYRRLGYNVWALDTNRFVYKEFPLAARSIRAAGKRTGEMLANITNENTGFDPKKFEMVGLSLGGQTISFIAKSYKALTGVKISRITGLDPAGPCFRHLGPEDRLDDSDADKVDVIMTNIDGLGLAAPVGHVNFYVNGGEYQPGDIFWLPCTILCSHMRVFTLWLSVLGNPDSFIAMRCNSVQQARDHDCYNNKPSITNVVGLKTNWSEPGIFYLATENDFPYHMGKRGLKPGQQYFMNQLKNSNNVDILRI